MIRLVYKPDSNRSVLFFR